MPDRDWSLVFFTTLAQWSVGIVLWLTWPVLYHQGSSPIFETGLSLMNPVLLALIFIGSATLSSFLHLGNPANAPKAINNLSGSWLSREILAIGVFTASLVITLVVGWKTGNTGQLKYLLALSSLCGVALLWTMSRVYIMPTIPAWNTWFTPAGFVLTALGLGLLNLLILYSFGSIVIAGHIARVFWIAIISILLIEILAALAYQHSLTGMEQGMAKLEFGKGSFYRVYIIRLAILIFTFGLAVALAYQPGLLPGDSYSLWVILLSISSLLQELTGRLLFYSSYFRTGV